MNQKIRVCKECGSENIFFDAYVGVNDPTDVRTFDAVFCDDCGKQTGAVSKRLLEMLVRQGFGF